jgi:hypothetical protein
VSRISKNVADARCKGAMTDAGHRGIVTRLPFLDGSRSRGMCGATASHLSAGERYPRRTLFPNGGAQLWHLSWAA